MTQTEYYDLLMKDLCGRLHYGTMISINGDNQYLDSIIYDDGYYVNFVGDNKEGYSLYYNDIKPYLFPLSSMTEEQQKEYRKICDLDMTILENRPMKGEPFPAMYNSQDWLDAHHFDYRGLIPMGLAIDATGKNIY